MNVEMISAHFFPDQVSRFVFACRITFKSDFYKVRPLYPLYQISFTKLNFKGDFSNFMAKGITGLSDNELLAVANQMATVLAANPANYGTTAPDVTAFQAFIDGFESELAAQAAALAASKAATVNKETARTTVESQMRSFRDTGKLTAKDSEMAALGLPASSDPSPNATVPTAAVNTSERLRHTLSWSDAAAPVGSKKRPRGAMGAEIWVKIDGPPPGSEKDCTYLALDSATPYLAEYDSADAGKTAHYMLRWRMRDGATGAFGETVSATITG